MKSFTLTWQKPEGTVQKLSISAAELEPSERTVVDEIARKLGFFESAPDEWISPTYGLATVALVNECKKIGIEAVFRDLLRDT